ncbi:MAG TPA: hypothetical protein VK457_18690 [Chloroflexota bacterium]|nr:hypothetical protein [Chloroflexota bacterium]
MPVVALVAGLLLLAVWVRVGVPRLEPSVSAVLPSGPERSAMSQPARGQMLGAQLDGDVSAEAVLPSDYDGPALALRVRSNVAAIRAALPGPSFQPTHLFDLTLMAAATGREVEVPGLRVEIRVAIRQPELDLAEGDPQRLAVFHYRAGAWEDTGAVVDGNVLVASVASLSPFAVVVLDQPRLPGLAPLAQPATARAGLSEPDPALDAGRLANPTGSTRGEPPDPALDTERLSSPAGQPSLPLAQTPAFGQPLPAAPPAVSSPIDPLPAAEPPQLPPPSAPPSPAPPVQGSGPGPSPSPIASPPPQSVLFISTPGSSNAILSRSGVVPGDSWSYNLVVRNEGTADFAYSLTTNPTVTSGLDDPASFGLSPAAGLRFSVSRCSSGFTTCGTTLYDGPVQVQGQALGQLPKGADDYLRLTVRLLATSGNEFQQLSSLVNLTWVAVPA